MLKAAQPIRLPEGVSVYDVAVDVKLGSWHMWHDKPLDRARPIVGHFNNAPHVRFMITYL